MIHQVNTASGLVGQPFPPLTAQIAAQDRLNNVDFTDADAVGQVYERLRHWSPLAQFVGWALLSGDQAKAIEALLTLMMRKHALARGERTDRIPGTWHAALMTLAPRLSPRGLDALMRSVGDVPEANEFSEFLSAQDQWSLMGMVHQQQADFGENVVFTALDQRSREGIPADECRRVAQQDYGPVHAKRLEAIAALRTAAAAFEAKGLPHWAAKLYVAIAEIWTKMARTFNTLEQPKQADDARAAAHTAYTEGRDLYRRTMDAATLARQPDVVEHTAREAGKIDLIAAHHLTVNHQYVEAIAAYESAITVFLRGGEEANAADAHMHLGDLYVQLERYPDAAHMFLKGVSERRRDPSWTDVLLLARAGFALKSEGKDDQAKATFERAGDTCSRLAKTLRTGGAEARAVHYGWAGGYYLDAGQYQKAIDALRAAMHAHTTAGALVEARRAHERIADAYELLAKEYARRGEFGRAGDAHTRAAEEFDALRLDALWLDTARWAECSRQAREHAGEAYEVLAAEYARQGKHGLAGDLHTRAAQMLDAAGWPERSRQAHGHAGDLYMEFARRLAQVNPQSAEADKAVEKAGKSYRNAQQYQASVAAYQMWTDNRLRLVLSAPPITGYLTFAIRCRELAKICREAGLPEAAHNAEMTAAAAYLKDDHIRAAAEAFGRAREFDLAKRTYQYMNEWAGLPTLHPDIFDHIAESYRENAPEDLLSLHLVTVASKAVVLVAVDPVDRLKVAAERVLGTA
ncbi:tetratricopeptide repeat protein [Pandoraea sputorum]|uniref:Tetratricopeptide repeat protein n=1 Tax=Pandoraea sputorum TaxID=93222 RepID=A0A5E5BLU6_9BURK|nr:hypothetical protein [Pandoraea sputorum]VVE86025.1 hypothetical protein PSP31121_05664 [Pandoraea sputorum]